jgi:tetratricopeptide (TPR) repeat protein
MKNTMILFTLAAAALLAPSAARADYNGVVADGWGPHMARALDNVADARFEKGLALVDEYIAAFPEECGGYFYYAAAVQETLQKKNDLSLLPVFNRYAEKTIAICGRQLAIDPANAPARFYLGAINGYIGLVKARQQKLVDAFMAAVEAKKHLEQVYVEAPDMADNHLALGMLYFFASREAKRSGGMLGWVVKTFITHGRDMREEGIRLLTSAVENRALGEPYATAALMWIRLYDGRYADARRHADDMAARYPRDTISRWVLGRLALYDARYGDALIRFTQVERLLVERGVDVAARYPDVAFGQQWARLMMAVEDKRYDDALELSRWVERWLHTSPTVGIEYQNARQFVDAWKKRNIVIRRKILRDRD